MTTQSSAGSRSDIPRGRGRTVHRRLERLEMRVLVALTFPLFLIVAIANRLGLRRSSFAAVTAIRPRSVFAEARMTAEATIPSAFRG
jgi:hypothetical protein